MRPLDIVSSSHSPRDLSFLGWRSLTRQLALRQEVKATPIGGKEHSIVSIVPPSPPYSKKGFTRERQTPDAQKNPQHLHHKNYAHKNNKLHQKTLYTRPHYTTIPCMFNLFRRYFTPGPIPPPATEAERKAAIDRIGRNAEAKLLVQGLVVPPRRNVVWLEARILELESDSAAFCRTVTELKGEHGVAKTRIGELETIRLSLTAERDAALRRIVQLEYAARGGNATSSTAAMLIFIADRLENVYGENPNLDYIRCAHQRAGMLDEVLADREARGDE